MNGAISIRVLEFALQQLENFKLRDLEGVVIATSGDNIFIPICMKIGQLFKSNHRDC
jgi:hypothetical protein